MKIKLPELPEPVGAMTLAAWGPKPDMVPMDQVIAYATAAVKMNRPVVDEAMVDRALRSLPEPSDEDLQDAEMRKQMRAALQAALGEQG